VPENIYAITDRKNPNASAEFVELLHKSGLLNQFEFHQITMPVLHFRGEFIDYIAEHGLSSIYNFSILREDITSPSLGINEIEKVVAKFVARLDGAKRVMIIDPYLYVGSSKVDVVGVFKNLLGKASSALEEIIFVTNGKKTDAKPDIHAAVSALVPNCKIVDVVTSEFHDRFWIDPDAGKGLVMGTSLNGLGRKIALVDKLQDADVLEIVKLAKVAGAPV
jgi:hypothetical protein